MVVVLPIQPESKKRAIINWVLCTHQANLTCATWQRVVTLSIIEASEVP